MTAPTSAGPVAGRVADGFEPVRDVFTATLDGVAGGAAVALVVDGRTVVDLWGGRADAGGPPDRWSAGALPAAGAGYPADNSDGERPWTRSTRAVTFSVTKATTTLCLLHAAGRGLLDLDAPVSTVWPEFAAHGKDRVTVRQTLAHRAGLPLVEAPLTRADVLGWEPVVRALAAQRPLWEPGSAWAYHAVTFGWLAGEVLRRVSGHTPGSYLREEFTAPLGLRTEIGVPVGEQSDIATVIGPAPLPAAALARLDDHQRTMLDLARRALTMNGALPFPGQWGETDGADDETRGSRHVWNDPDVLAAEIPGANGVGSAADLAGLFAAVLGTPGRPALVDRDVLTAATRPLSSGPPLGGGPGETGSTRGTGFIVPGAGEPLLSPGSFGHSGAGGQFALGDLRLGAGFAYLTNRMGGDGDDRATALMASVRGCLG